VAAFGTPVAAHGDQQEGGSPAERLVGQATDHGATRDALTATPTAPLVGVDDPAGEHSPSRFEALADDLQAELVKAGERGQVGANEGSVGHVEVFQMGSVRTSIFGRPRPSTVMSP
jgi:hypothetical protein